MDRIIIIAGLVLLCMLGGCMDNHVDEGKSNKGQPPLPSISKDDPKYKEKFAFSLVIDDKIKEGKTRISDLKTLFKDYPKDFEIIKDDLAVFYFYEQPHDVNDNLPPEALRKSVCRHGRYMEFHFPINDNGYLESITISSSHKGFIRP